MTTDFHRIDGRHLQLALDSDDAPCERLATAELRRGDVFPPAAAGEPITVQRIKELIESGSYVWCARIGQRRRGVGDGGGWLVGAAPVGSDYAFISRSDSTEFARAPKVAAGLARGKEPPKAQVKALVEAMLAGDRDTVAKLAPSASPGSFQERRPHGGDPSTVHPLFVAATSKDAWALESLLPHVLVDAEDDEGRTALAHAVEARSRACVEALIAAGADAKVASRDGATPLMRASRVGARDILDLLLPGSDPKARDESGRTALMLACEAAFVECVEALIPHSDLEARDVRGETALLAASRPANIRDGGRERMAACVALLARSGAEVDAVDWFGNTALTRLVSDDSNATMRDTRPRQSPELMEALIKAGADARAMLPNGDSLLATALRRDLDSYFDALLPLSDAKHAGEGGETALIIASRMGDIGKVRRLAPLSDLDARDGSGATALLACLQSPSPESSHRGVPTTVVLRLLPGSDVDARDLAGNALLPALVEAGEEELFLLALQRADPNIQDGKGRSALMWAMASESMLFFERLLPVADASLVDEDGATALHHAVMERRWRPTGAERARLVAELLDMAKSEVDRQDRRGRTALMLAAGLYGRSGAPAVDVLLRFANVGLRDTEGLAAEDYARRAGDEEMARMLAAFSRSQDERRQLGDIPMGRL